MSEEFQELAKRILLAQRRAFLAERKEINKVDKKAMIVEARRRSFYYDIEVEDFMKTNND